MILSAEYHLICYFGSYSKTLIVDNDILATIRFDYYLIESVLPNLWGVQIYHFYKHLDTK